jgi:transposase InsO family protein
MRSWLRAYATKHPCHGFRRAWAALRYDERREVNKKKVHRLWRAEGLQVKITSPRKRAGVSSIPLVEADAPKVVWAIDFQFDSTIDGKAIKIASMIDEHTRCSLLNLVERSITAERLITELETVFARAGGPPKVLRMDNDTQADIPGLGAAAAVTASKPSGTSTVARGSINVRSAIMP